MKSSSIHSLNADKFTGLARWPQRGTWLMLNWLNNTLFPHAGAQHLAMCNFVADTRAEKWSQLGAQDSPSRKLGDLLWMQLPWARIQSELGQINVFDTGCGSGAYAAKLSAYSGNRIASYFGVDIEGHGDWDGLASEHPSFRFRVLDSANILSHIPDDANFFMSQSAIEHFDQDLVYFEQIREFIRRKSNSIIQVHLFPSSICLKLYLLHGVRQYTPRTISYITRLFHPFSYSVLLNLGGRNCNALHWEHITKPTVGPLLGLSYEGLQGYDSRLVEAIEADAHRSHFQPSFYALIIHSNWRERFLEQIADPI